MCIFKKIYFDKIKIYEWTYIFIDKTLELDITLPPMFTTDD